MDWKDVFWRLPLIPEGEGLSQFWLLQGEIDCLSITEGSHIMVKFVTNWGDGKVDRY